MDRESILATLRAHESELKAAGLLHLRLFGSVARGDDTPDSDVDLLFDCDYGDFDKVLRAYGYQDDLCDLLGRRAHLSSAGNIRPEMQTALLAECIDVF